MLGLVFTAKACVLFGLIGYCSGTVGGGSTVQSQGWLWLDRVAGRSSSVLGLRLDRDA